MNKPMVAVCALALLSLSTVAAADEARMGDLRVGDDAGPYVQVPYGDLNLQNQAGAATMLNRVSFAAKRVCGGTPDLREIKVYALFKTCVRQAKADAVRNLNMPLVTALHEQQVAKEEQHASVN
jgi:UrcA family protein